MGVVRVPLLVTPHDDPAQDLKLAVQAFATAVMKAPLFSLRAFPYCRPTGGAPLTAEALEGLLLSGPELRRPAVDVAGDVVKAVLAHVHAASGDSAAKSLAPPPGLGAGAGADAAPPTPTAAAPSKLVLSARFPPACCVLYVSIDVPVQLTRPLLTQARTHGLGDFFGKFLFSMDHVTLHFQPTREVVIAKYLPLLGHPFQVRVKRLVALADGTLCAAAVTVPSNPRGSTGTEHLTMTWMPSKRDAADSVAMLKGELGPVRTIEGLDLELPGKLAFHYIPLPPQRRALGPHRASTHAPVACGSGSGTPVTAAA